MPGGSKENLVEQFLSAILAGSTVEDAAWVAGISTRTAFRWLGRPWAKERLRDARATMLRETLTRLMAARTKAVDTLAELVSVDGGGPPMVRLLAAEKVIAMSAKLAEKLDLEERMTEVEQKLKRREQQKQGK